MFFNFSLNLDWAEQVAMNAPQGQFLDLILTFLWFLNCTFHKKKQWKTNFKSSFFPRMFCIFLPVLVFSGLISQSFIKKQKKIIYLLTLIRAVSGYILIKVVCFWDIVQQLLIPTKLSTSRGASDAWLHLVIYQWETERTLHWPERRVRISRPVYCNYF